MKTQLLIATIVATLAATVALADKVTLVSGSTLTGTAGDFSGGKLKFTSDDLGDLTIDVKKIASLESDKMHVVRYRDMSVSSVPVTVVDGEYQVAGAALDMTNVKDLDPAPGYIKIPLFELGREAMRSALGLSLESRIVPAPIIDGRTIRKFNA